MLEGLGHAPLKSIEKMVQFGAFYLSFYLLAFITLRFLRLVVRQSGEPPRDPNQLDASLVIDYKRLTPGEAKETHPIPRG